MPQPRVTPLDRAIAAEIRAWEGRDGWSRKRLAAAADVNVQTLGYYERGVRAWPASVLYYVTEALGITLDGLMAEVRERHPEAFISGAAETTEAREVGLAGSERPDTRDPGRRPHGRRRAREGNDD